MGTDFFWQDGPCRFISKGFVAHDGILLLPPCKIARCRVVVNLWAKRSGGLDFSKPPTDNVNWAHKTTCPTTVFFFPRYEGQDGFIYYFDCFKLLCPNSLFNDYIGTYPGHDTHSKQNPFIDNLHGFQYFSISGKEIEILNCFEPQQAHRHNGK